MTGREATPCWGAFDAVTPHGPHDYDGKRCPGGPTAPAGRETSVQADEDVAQRLLVEHYEKLTGREATCLNCDECFCRCVEYVTVPLD